MKTLLKILISIMLTCLCLFGLSACEETENGDNLVSDFIDYLSIETIKKHEDYIPHGTNCLKYTLLENGNYKATMTCYTIPDVVVPSLYNDKRVEIVDGFYGEIKSVRIGYGVTCIGDGAFSNCQSLEIIKLPNSITNIGNYAFSSCSSLKEYVIPNSVENIGVGVFVDTPFYNDESNWDNGILYSGNYLLSVSGVSGECVIKDDTICISNRAFSNQTTISKVRIPKSVIYMGTNVFAGSDVLFVCCEAESQPSKWDNNWASVEISDSNVKIPVVWNCNNNDVADDGFIYTMVDGLFYGLKDNVAKVASRQINDITNVNIQPSITYKNNVYNVTSIDSYSFKNKNIGDITIPSSVTHIGKDAFYLWTELYTESNNELNKVNYLGSVDQWAEIEFENIYSSPLLKGEYKGFGGNKGRELYINGDLLTKVNFSTATKISDFAFCACDSITEVTIPDSVTNIGVFAFADCPSLTSITIPNSVINIDDEAIVSCYVLTVYCESNTKPDRWGNDWNLGAPTVWNCNNNDVADDGFIYTMVEGIRYAIKDNVAKVVGQPNNITNANVLSSITYKGNSYDVTSIERGAFVNCDSLTSVIIGNSVTSIESDAFVNCDSLTSVTIGNSVNDIYGSAFNDCVRLVEVINNSPNITVEKGSSGNGCLGYYALSVSNCDDSYVSKLSTDNNGYVIYTVGEDKILVGYVGEQTELTLPSEITKIYLNAFRDNGKIISVTFSDASTWYMTYNNANWENKTGGWEIDVTNPSDNAINLMYTYLYKI